ncbi:MAG: dihydroxyacetone kinase subunit DhaK, partial [Alicyclobacillus herbarius]|uniref:dihydroxyacetone kinase subunit DhaK n=1 Tax=Alicyclobacillus herbarius TaxID=122960 RepID=UPI00235690BA
CGFVGYGMLDAAVAGDIFTSPTPDQVLAAIEAVDSGMGVLLVIKNYTGDVMNFEMAAELAEAKGISVEQVIVNDDIAVEDSTYTVGRRGIVGTVFVHKIAGAAAEAGWPLAEVKRVAEKGIRNVASMGVALSPCVSPITGQPSFELADGEIELGVGIHGEPGIERTDMLPANDLVDVLFARIHAEKKLQAGTKVAVILNGLGGTPVSELYVCYRRLAQVLAELGVQIHGALVGEYMTALDMSGFSMSILELDDELTQLLDAPTLAPSWDLRAV